MTSTIMINMIIMVEVTSTIMVNMIMVLEVMFVNISVNVE